MERYTEEKLMKMSVHTLRVILRSEFNGVPGVCNKSELIEQILSIQSGGDAPTRSTKGRKPLGEFITPINTELVFSDVSEDVEESTFIKGVFELNEEGYGLVRRLENGTNKDYFVSNSFVKRYALRTGYVVEGSVDNTSGFGMPRIKAITFVNGRSAEDVKEVSRDFSRSKYPTEKLELCSSEDVIIKALNAFCPIGKGQRCLVEDDGGKFGTAFAKSVTASLSQDSSVKVISLFVGARPEDLDEDYGENVTVISTNLADSSEDLLRIISLTVERAKVLTQLGEDVVLIVDGLTAIRGVYEDYLLSEKKSSGFIKSGVTPAKYVYDLFSVGGNFGTGKSLTVIATVNMGREERLLAELEGVATSNIKLKADDTIKRRGYVIDLASSYTDKDELLLTNEQIELADGKRKELNKNAKYYKEIYLELLK